MASKSAKKVELEKRREDCRIELEKGPEKILTSRAAGHGQNDIADQVGGVLQAKGSSVSVLRGGVHQIISVQVFFYSLRSHRKS